MDCYVPSARVGTLVVPAGRLTPQRFKELFKLLEDSASIVLTDSRLPSTFPHDITAIFDPQTYPNGRVRLNFTTAENSPTLKPLEDLEPWRQQMLVCAVADFDPEADYEQIVKQLKNRYSNALCHVVLVFDKEPIQEELPAHVFAVVTSKFTGVEAALSDVVGELLGQLSIYWISRRMGTFDSPGAKLQGSAKHVSSDKKTAQSVRRGHGLGHIARDSGVLVGRTGSIHMGSSDRARKKQQARTAKFLGSLKLLTGRVNEALPDLVNAALALKENHDPLWYGSALEELVGCLVLQRVDISWTSRPLLPAPILVAAGLHPEDKQADKKEPPELSVLVTNLTEAALAAYREGTDDEKVPHTVYYETIIRFAGLLARARLCGGGWTEEALRSAVDGRYPSKTVAPKDWTDLEKWLQQVLNPSLQDLPSLTQVRLLGAVANIYARIGLRRKWAFTSTMLISAISSSQEPLNVEVEGLVEAVMSAYDSWPKLKIMTLKHTIAVGERSGSPALQVRAAASLLGMATHSPIDRKQQLALYQIIRSVGDLVPHPYWDPEVIVSVQLRLSSIGSTNSAPEQKRVTANTTEKGAIIYNPYDQKDSQAETTAEQGIPVYVRVVLRNPFAIEAQVYELFLVGPDGQRVSETTRDVIMAPETMSIRVDVPIVPKECGPLTIAGCYIQVAGCTGSVHDLPKPISFNVTPERPEVLLKSLSLQKGWAMLLEGETISFSLELWNASKTTIAEDLQFGFTDSSVDPLKQNAMRPELTKTDTYEYEYFLYKRQTIDMISSLKPIEPQTAASFDFTLTGKRCITSAAIMLDYSGPGSMLSRRIRIPLQVTVWMSIDLERVDVLPSSQKDEILVVLDLRNAWRQRLEVNIDTDIETVSRTIDSMQSQRFIVRLPWSPPPSEELRMPIPSLAPGKSGQYVRDTRTPSDVTETFWLREALLSKIKGRWSTCSRAEEDKRTGLVELRGIKLTRRMADVLRSRPVSVEMSAPASAAVDELVVLKVTLTNSSSSPRSGMLRFIPDAVGETHLLYMGTLQRPVTVAANSSVSVELEVVYLASGVYEWSSIFDVFASQEAVFQNDVHSLHIL